MSAAGSLIPRRAALNTTQWHAGAKFSKKLIERVAAHWYLGVAHNQFSVDGFTRVLTPTLPVTDGALFGSFTLQNVPNAEPDAEFGVNWGAGFDWSVHPRVDMGLEWRRHHTGVIDVDSYRLSVVARL